MQKWLTLLLVYSIALTGCNEQSQQASTLSVPTPATTSDDNPIADQEPLTEITPAAETFDELISLIKSTIGETDSQPPTYPFDPPLTTADAKSLLEQCLQMVLTDSKFKNSREFYGTAGDSIVFLTDGLESRWPADFKPNFDGFDLEFKADVTQETEGKRVLGIRLDKLDFSAPTTRFMDGNITFTTYNAGGSENGAVIGGCFHFFTVHRDGENLVVRYSGSLDP